MDLAPSDVAQAPALDVSGDLARMAELIAQTTDDVIFAKDLGGRYRYVNPATLAVFGLALDQVLGRTDREILGDEALAARLVANDRRVLDSGEAQEMEESLPGADGTDRHWLTRKVPLRDAGGRVLGLLGIARDVTERKLAAQRRDAATLKLEMAVQAAGLVLAEIDYRTNRNHISAELARLLELGDGAMTVPREAIFERVHPDDRARYLEAVGRATDPAGDGLLAIDVRGLLPSGRVRWLHIRLKVVFAEIDGVLRADRGYCAAREVTAEILADRKLRAAQRLTESVIEGAGAPVHAKDLAGRYFLSNQAWRTLHGVPADRAEGLTDEALFGADAARALQANDRLVLETGRALVVQEQVAVQGGTVTFRSSKFPLYDEEGRIYAVCGVSTDITDVIEADRRKDEFLATLAHELRNPLAPIRTGLEILKRAGALPPAADRAREVMDRQLTHMVRLIDDLLDVSRITRDKLRLQRAPLTVQQVVEHALEASESALQAEGHRLELVLPPHPVRIDGDLTRLAQVVSNLLNNAARYTPPGGRVTLRVEQAGREVGIVVEDDGSGIAPELLPHVFELFAQGTTQPQAKRGLGIGLWLVRKLVALHGGRVEVASAGPGQGSRFEVRLPVDAGV